jgi:zinc/manganese transport system permease protein
MNEALELLALPLVASLILIGIHCQFGLQVLKRNVVFVDLALAQCAALGATVAFMQGHLPQSVGAYAWSLGFAWGAALLLSLIRYAPTRIAPEALVGVLYVVAAAAAMLLIEQAPQGAEHLKQILTGSVLTVSAEELYRVAPLYLVIGGLLAYAVWRGWLGRSGMAGWLADLAFYAAFGIVVTSSVALAGVLLVFSFLIIPALIGLLWAARTSQQLLIGWACGGIAAAGGLAASYALDTSSGATMVCAFGLVLTLALLLHALRAHATQMRKVGAYLGYAVLLLLVSSAAWLLIQPRADQPLLDASEALWPGLRSAYFTQPEHEAYTEASRYIERYTREGERLTEVEARARWQEATPDDMLVRKISSFQQAYTEMIKGERFVMHETRARARERLRWPLLGGLLTILAIAGASHWLRRPQTRRDTNRNPKPTAESIGHPA